MIPPASEMSGDLSRIDEVAVVPAGAGLGVTGAGGAVG